jgi:hypothetical protein
MQHYSAVGIGIMLKSVWRVYQFSETLLKRRNWYMTFKYLTYYDLQLLLTIFLDMLNIYNKMQQKVNFHHHSHPQICLFCYTDFV